MVENGSGEYASMFTVKKSFSSTSDGEYSLLWNVTDDEEVIAISMRSIASSNEWQWSFCKSVWMGLVYGSNIVRHEE